VNGSLNRRVLDKWMGLILLYCLQNPGITVGDVALRFNLMQALQIRHLLEVCVSLSFSFRFGALCLLEIEIRNFSSRFSISNASTVCRYERW